MSDLLSDDGIWHELLPGAQASEVALSVGASGSYVRVQLDGTNPLSLAEVEVLGTADPLPLSTNLALAGTTSQSSTGFGGVPRRATDGNRSGVWREGSVTHTQSEAQPWWDLSLAERSSIDSIVLYNRTDCCSGRLSDVHVFVSEQPFGDRTLSDLLSDDGIWHELLPGAQASEVALSVGASGSYVRVQLDGTNPLSLAEVEVLGTADPLPVNLALAGTTSQSSTGFRGVAGRATDGNRSGVWREGSVTHTQSEAQPWWDLSLAERSSIDSIVLYNRTDCCSGRLSDVHVFVSEQPFGDRTLSDLLSDDGIWHELLPGAQASEVALSVGASGSYVRVQLDGTNALSLAEVEVVGRGQ